MIGAVTKVMVKMSITVYTHVQRLAIHYDSRSLDVAFSERVNYKLKVSIEVPETWLP